MTRSISAFSPLADRMVAENRAHVRQQNRLRKTAQFKRRLAYTIGPTLLLAMGATVIASAQSNSPFANKNKVQAWEQAPTNTEAQTQTGSPQTRSNPSNSGVPPLRLRTRSLDPETAAAPPPSNQQRPPAVASAPIIASPRSGQTATQASIPAPRQAPVRNVEARPQSMPSESAPTVASQTPLTPQPSISGPPTASAASAYTAQPLNSPPLGSSPRPAPSVQAVPSQNYVYNAPTQTPLYNPPSAPRQTMPQPYARSSGAYGSSGSYGKSGDYGNVPRGSVNNPPSRSVDNQTDWTVHQLAGRPPSPYGAPQSNSGDWGDRNWSGSNQPTASDFGYSRQGQSSPPQTAPSRNPNSQPYPDQGPYNQGPFSGPLSPDQNSYPPQKQGFFQRIGFGALTRFIRGTFGGGVAARESDGWEEAFVGLADVEAEVSAVTQGGLEWGVHGQVRAQYDEARKGFTRRLPDCPPTVAGCASVTLPGFAGPASVRGHTSQFYTFGPDVAEDAQIAIESAHVFLRSAYGDVTVGRDDGAAFLFSLGAPSLLNVGASNSPVDYTGLDAVKTVNDASGFAEKVTYTSPRLLGDQVGVGIQIGASYAPDARGCGVDYCVDLNDVPNVIAPDIRDVMEVGLALDRTFAPGVSVELTGTYATGSEKSGVTGLDDLSAYGAGLEFRVRDWTLGGSYLNSNQGLSNGDYEAYDVGLTWKPSRLGFTVGYGHAKDDNVSLTTDQITGGVSFDLNERIRLGVGAQFADRETLRLNGGTAQPENDKATALFFEGRFSF